MIFWNKIFLIENKTLNTSISVPRVFVLLCLQECVEENRAAREQILQQLKGYFESDKLTKLAQQFAAHMLIRMPTVKDQNESKHVKFNPKLSKITIQVLLYRSDFCCGNA